MPRRERGVVLGSYLEQRREALEKWAAYLERIAGSGGKVSRCRPESCDAGSSARDSLRRGRMQATEYPLPDPDLQVGIPTPYEKAWNSRE